MEDETLALADNRPDRDRDIDLALSGGNYLEFAFDFGDESNGNMKCDVTYLDHELINGEVDLPPLDTQKKIAVVLSTLDDKIELNNAINENLEEQSRLIFKNMLPAMISNEISVGEYITPKRRKCLLVKDTIHGDVPVVARGIESATYHNESNTSVLVLTISASMQMQDMLGFGIFLFVRRILLLLIQA